MLNEISFHSITIIRACTLCLVSQHVLIRCLIYASIIIRPVFFKFFPSKKREREKYNLREKKRERNTTENEKFPLKKILFSIILDTRIIYFVLNAKRSFIRD